jgi:hypothetical protein
LIAFADVGPVSYFPVSDADGVVGKVWVAEHPHARPRAGIAVTPTSERADPSETFQRDFGPAALALWQSMRATAQLLAELRATITPLVTGDVDDAPSIDALRHV